MYFLQYIYVSFPTTCYRYERNSSSGKTVGQTHTRAEHYARELCENTVLQTKVEPEEHKDQECKCSLFFARFSVKSKEISSEIDSVQSVLTY